MCWKSRFELRETKDVEWVSGRECKPNQSTCKKDEPHNAPIDVMPKLTMRDGHESPRLAFPAALNISRAAQLTFGAHVVAHSLHQQEGHGDGTCIR